MTKTRFSHAQCEHPSTKAARAKCRKEMRGEAVASAASTPKPVAVTPTKKKDPRKAATAVPAKVETPADETTPESAPAVQTETAPAAEPVEITPDTWRDHKDKAASVYINGVAEPFAAQCITGWSIKFLQFTDSEGKRQRIPASTVERVTV
ncbi:hypothetical protein QCN29_36200 [Streptomyces sp. HNM0663]|uniref:Uncharacterized protein n=1 Tax=Streptomyces chengmaiensis TaxID=3040919 RepID=A0ABT6HZE5_9ACTN|nr:hypothetical protein [Streptomyces chengmaiensis]MDH2394087.1 hypothetical protein [Streptomyces chengmaiensis]